MKNEELSVLHQRVLTTGSERISDTDLLGLVIGSPHLARSLYKAASKWTDLGPSELKSIPRFTVARVVQILALVELSRRINTEPLVNGQAVCCSEDVTKAYGPRLSDKKREVFLALSLDSKNRVIGEHVIALGSLTEVPVHPREVFRKLILDAAASAVFVHNHPSGDPTPSPHDVAMSKRLVKVGELVGITLLDFIIVGSEGATSFRDLGLMGGD